MDCRPIHQERVVYDTWKPLDFGGICSAIDQLPSKTSLDLDVSVLSGPHKEPREPLTDNIRG